MATPALYCKLKATGLKVREPKVSGPNITGRKPIGSFWHSIAGDQYVLLNNLISSTMHSILLLFVLCPRHWQRLGQLLAKASRHLYLHQFSICFP